MSGASRLTTRETIIDEQRIALGVQQPWVELILRGLKTMEIRSTPTSQRGRIYLYASRKYSHWLFAAAAMEEHQIETDELVTGMIVGSVEIVDVRPATRDDSLGSCVPPDILEGQYAWRLANPQRLATPIAPRFLPYGIWFYPFRRKGSSHT